MKPPSFSFYVRDWLCSETVRALHRTRKRFVGAYLFLICESWNQDVTGTLPNDAEILAELARVDAGEWQELWPMIQNQFELGPDNRLHNIKLKNIRDRQIINRENGMKGQFKPMIAGKSANRPATRQRRTP